MVNIVSQHSLRLVQQLGSFFFALAAVEYFLQEVGVVSSCGFDEEFSW